MQQKNIDLLVIGGGINGVGVAANAAGQGLSVILCEKDDLANHTSSASSKLIHGGLRYLEQYEFRLVREALGEREILLHIAPHLVHPLEFVLPHDAHLRPKWLIRLGLFFYDALASQKSLPASQKIKFKQDARGKPLQKKFTVGFSYGDCQTDDARLVISNALLAKEKGATILTRTEITKIDPHPQGFKVEAYDKLLQSHRVIIAKGIVNATGAWVAEVLEKRAGISPKFCVKWVKGSHIVLPKLYEGDHAYILQNPDQRIIFVIPYKKDYTLIGTTDVIYTEDPNHVAISKKEILYLLDSVNYYFQSPVREEAILWSYAGIRALYNPESGKRPSKITREYYLDLNIRENKFPFLSIVGGKLTTYRSLAEHVLEKLKPYFPSLTPSWTRKAILPGGDLNGLTFFQYYQQLKKAFPFLGPHYLFHLLENYGSYAMKILTSITKLEDLGQRFTADLYAAEVNYLLDNEWAKTAEDILWRRTKFGPRASLEEREKLEEYCQEHLKI